MGLQFARLRRLVFLGGVALAMSPAARAQDGGQPILFSVPEGGNAPPHSAQPTGTSSGLANAVQAPFSLGGNSSGGGAAPPPPPPRASRPSSNGNDWALMTPEEILGVAMTPEKILQVPMSGAAAQAQSLTPMERFAARQMQAEEHDSSAASLWPALSGGKAGGHSSLLPPAGPDGSPAGYSPVLSHFMDATPAPDQNAFTGQRESGGWSKLFGTAAAAPASPDAAQQLQQTDLNRVRNLLEPAPAPVAAAAEPDMAAFASPNASHKPVLSQSPADLVGTAYTPLARELGRPADLPALSGNRNQKTAPSTQTSAQSRPLPPWLIQGPQPFVMPQRKF
ncbi:MAG: hypothetical protein KGJ60_10415 [Verrucomicrobiota bacterium]|nr:hypothetical protein [Verrucomicrobiota bacterium]